MYISHRIAAPENPGPMCDREVTIDVGERAELCMVATASTKSAVAVDDYEPIFFSRERTIWAYPGTIIIGRTSKGPKIAIRDRDKRS